MSEDWRVEDRAEKLAESPSAAIMEYISEHGIANWKDLIELLAEKCDLSEDEAEKLLKSYLKSGRLKYSNRRGGYYWFYEKKRYIKPGKFRGIRIPPRRKAKATIGNVMRALHLPPDPHTLPSKSHFLAKDWHPYYHPAMDRDKLAYLRAKKKMGAGADWL